MNHPAITGCAGRPFRRSRGAALHIIVALFVIIGLLHAAAAEPLSREAFTQKVVAALEAARPGGEIRVLGPLRLQVADEKGNLAAANLEGAFVEYRLDPGELESVVRRYVAAYASALPPERRPIAHRPGRQVAAMDCRLCRAHERARPRRRGRCGP